MAKVPKELILKRAPAIYEFVIFGKGWLWFKSKQEVWPAWFQWKLMPAWGLYVEANYCSLGKQGWPCNKGDSCWSITEKLAWCQDLKKELEMSVSWEQWVLFHSFIAFPKRVCGYWLCGYRGWFIVLSIFSRCFSRFTLKRKQKTFHLYWLIYF